MAAVLFCFCLSFCFLYTLSIRNWFLALIFGRNCCKLIQIYYNCIEMKTIRSQSRHTTNTWKCWFFCGNGNKKTEIFVNINGFVGDAAENINQLASTVMGQPKNTNKIVVRYSDACDICTNKLMVNGFVSFRICYPFLWRTFNRTPATPNEFPSFFCCQ